MKARTLIIAVLLVFMLSACSGGSDGSIFPAGVELKPGDLVFRRGYGVTSRVVYGADRDGEYSHVGIVVDTAGVLMVVHAVPDEPDYEGDPDRVKIEDIDSFYDGWRAEMGEVCRVNDSEIAEKASKVALEMFGRRVLFDHDYNDDDTTEMYCCELVNHAYKRAGLDLVVAPRHHIHVPAMINVDCMLPSDLQHSPYVSSVIQF